MQKVFSTMATLNDVSSEGLVKPKKISLFRKVRRVFSFKSKLEGGERGRERSRTKSIAKLFSMKSEFQQRRSSLDRIR
jgi:hypothetical protein